MSHIIKEIATPIIQGATVFGICYGLGKLVKAPDALRGAVISTSSFLARFALRKLADSLEERHDWKKSTRYWVKIGFDALTLTAMTVTIIALGNIALLGVILFTAAPLIFIGVDIYKVTHLEEDLPLSERIPKRIEELRAEKSPKTNDIEALERRLIRTAQLA